MTFYPDKNITISIMYGNIKFNNSSFIPLTKKNIIYYNFNVNKNI